MPDPSDSRPIPPQSGPATAGRTGRHPGGKADSDGKSDCPADRPLPPFVRFSNAIAELAGRPATFTAAVALILLWAVSGPAFGFSETWQLVVNTGTTIVTFLMVFVLQNSQNRDGRAVQAKLDELILHSKAENKFIGAEKLDEKELRRLSDLLHQEAELADDIADSGATARSGDKSTGAARPRTTDSSN